jgi:hypothetical protein
MDLLTRRLLIPTLVLACRLQSQPATVSLRGRLEAAGDGAPALAVPARGLVPLTGDRPTVGVLRDRRLAGADLEVIGRFVDQRVFQIDPIHLRALFVHRGGQRLYVTYWCELCSIRTYTPGICWCCQQDTALDLREKDDS